MRARLMSVGLSLALVAMLGFGAGAASAADAEKAIADISAKAQSSMALLTFKVKLENGETPVGGQAVCIDPAGILITTILDPALKADQVKEMKLTLPGRDGAVLDAKFLGVDPVTRIGFIQAEGNFKWSAIQFADQPKLTPGQMVISAGVMGIDGNHTIYTGLAYVSAVMRVPNSLVYVTGGKLTSICSPVFTADGKAVGIVGVQLPMAFQTETEKGAVNVPLRGQDETSFFLPSDEFAFALRNVPKAGEMKRLPWTGAVGFEAVSEDNAKLKNIKLPAVIVNQVIPNQPAAQAGLKEGDIITAINGQPLEKLANPAFTVQNFQRELMKLQVGQKVEFTVLSGTTPGKVTITVGPTPTLPQEAPRLYDGTIGLLLRDKVDLDAFINKVPSANEKGLMVVAVADQSPAKAKGLSAGDLVVSVNDKPVRVVADYKVIADEMAKKGGDLKITFWSGASKQPVSVTVTPIRPAQP